MAFYKVLSFSSETVCTDIEKNSLWSEFVTFQTFCMLKQQHYTLKKVESIKKAY